jgi:transcriptional regulator with XRE-family HTH domain
MRTARGWSLGQLAQQAGVHKSALSRWEAGERLPRVPELETTLTALEATAAQRALVYAGMEAPRALRRLNALEKGSRLSAPPAACDLLRAMRSRGGWTQAQVAQRLGVGQNTVARWERGERLPSAEQMQALCFALSAQEEEIVALTTGRFAQAPEEMPADRQQVLESMNVLLYDASADLVDLRFLMLERGLWQQAMQDERAYSLLAAVLAAHAHYASLYERWEEVKTLAERALALTPPEEPTPSYTLRAALKLAEASVYGGFRLAPERGLSLLKAWLPRSSETLYTSWILSDMGEYLALAGQFESAVELGAKAVRITEHDQEMRRVDLGRLLLFAGRPGEALDQLPALSERDMGVFVSEAFVRCKAHLSLGERGEASSWLARTYTVIESKGLRYARSQADALARRL